MNLNNAYMRFLVTVLATVIVIRLAVALLVPVLPEIAVVLVAAALWQLWCYHRDHW